MASVHPPLIGLGLFREQPPPHHLMWLATGFEPGRVVDTPRLSIPATRYPIKKTMQYASGSSGGKGWTIGHNTAVCGVNFGLSGLKDCEVEPKGWWVGPCQKYLHVPYRSALR